MLHNDDKEGMWQAYLDALNAADKIITFTLDRGIANTEEIDLC